MCFYLTLTWPWQALLKPTILFIACTTLLKVGESLQVWMILPFQWETITFVEHVLQAVYFHTLLPSDKISINIVSHLTVNTDHPRMEILMLLVIQYSKSHRSHLCGIKRMWYIRTVYLMVAWKPTMGPAVYRRSTDLLEGILLLSAAN